MHVNEWLGVISLFLAILTLLGASQHRINQAMLAVKKENSEMVAETIKSEASKWDSIYKTLDEEKKDNEDKFVGVKVCAQIHKSSDQQFESLNEKIDTLTCDVKKLLSKAGIV